MDDFTPLDATRHMLRWFADDPYEQIRSTTEDNFRQQVPDSRLVEFRVTSEPQWLTGARPTGGPAEPDHTKTIIVRTGAAFEFAVSVGSRGWLEQLAGVFTWVAVDLDKPGRVKSRMWMDLNGTLGTFGSKGELRTRIYMRE